jgi:hypothetical protein
MRHAAVTGQACDSCHELGMAWYGEPNLWVRPEPDHHAGQDCGNSGCHRPQDKRLLRPAQTTAAAAPRTTTRTGSIMPATGTPASRPTAASALANLTSRPGRGLGPSLAGNGPTGALPLGLAARIIDHSRLVGACVSCHNGQSAVGAPPGHLVDSTRCDYCHTTNAWLPARFDHLAIAPRACASCHDGVRAIGMPRDHVRTAQSCDACHGTLRWTPVRVDHSGFVSGCAGCHNNAAAVGMTITHFRTQLDCSACHRYPDWGVITFVHTAAGYPGAHHATLACVACHVTNTEQVQYSSPASAGRCGGCHARDFKPAAHPMTVTGLLYRADQLADCTGACHVYDATGTKIVRSLPGPQHRISDAQF